MDEMTIGMALAAFAGTVWMLGAVLQWYNIRRQERLVARMTRLAVGRPRLALAATADEPPLTGREERLQAARRW